ncbi:MAG: glycosyltransferase family 2 protein [Caulobacterales bacterium]|nr:glycosyltransferase family 2 protein [Caulobacterales bacterium]MCA0371921.1 glycosyltransferase family 2 protein [Pseudomonadota bacterium]
MPKFSIILVSYKSGKDIDRNISCLMGQTYKNFETILIDNNSPENGVSIEASEKVNFFIQNDKNIGFAMANNQGAKLANGQWLVLLNPDAFPHESWLEEINKAIEKYPDCENFGCLQMLDGVPNMLDGAGDCFSIFGIAWRGGHRKPIPNDIEDGEVFASCGAASIWKKSRYEDLGGFEESYGSYYEDVDLGFRHRLEGGKCIQLANAIVSHKGSASSSRYSEYAVFHGIRNREIAYFRLMPFWLLVFTLPLHIFAVFSLWFHALIRGAFVPYSKGIMAAFEKTCDAIKQRQKIQKRRKASVFDILRIMSFSPFSLLSRAIIIRKIK